MLDDNGQQPELDLLLKFEPARDTIDRIEPADLQDRPQQEIQADQITKEHAEPSNYFNHEAHLTLGKEPALGEDSSDENERHHGSEQNKELDLPAGDALHIYGRPLDARQKSSKPNLFAGKDPDPGKNQERSLTGKKKSRKLAGNTSNLLNQSTPGGAHRDDDSMEAPLDRSSSENASFQERFSAQMPRHTLSNLQITRLSAKKSSRSRRRQADKAAASDKRMRAIEIPRLSFSRDAVDGSLDNKRIQPYRHKNDTNSPDDREKQSDTPRFKDKLLGALDKQGDDPPSSKDTRRENNDNQTSS